MSAGSYEIAGDAGRLRSLLPQARIVFDWNGTILDDLERTLGALNAVLVDFDREQLDDETFRRTFGLPLEAMLADLGLASDDIDPAVTAWYEGIEAREAPLSPGAAETIDALWVRGTPAGIISAASSASVERDADRLGIRDKLDFLRPAAASKEAALREVIVSDRPLIYVGDSEYDMTEAMAAGAIPVGYAGGYRPAEALLTAGAIAVVSDLRALLTEPM
ncbi:MAG TPA: HAD hydrolase-like protein [Thermomicrobiales bacterium]|nr:HAD hydrolase-like protein [Thermomicrobiales bacterium]